MKKIFLIFALFLSVTSFISNQSYAQDNWTGNVNFSFGAKALDKDDWTPLESQSEFGVNVDFGKKSWPFSIAIGFLASSKDDNSYGIKLEGSTRELRAGIIKIWEPTPTIRPYIGGGLAMINAKIEASDGYMGLSVDDQGVGGYANGGIYWILTKHLNLGFDLAYSRATLKLAGMDGEAGGGHASFFVGCHF
jgi:hypothetical protein